MARLTVLASCSVGAAAFTQAPTTLRSSALTHADEAVSVQVATLPVLGSEAAFGQNVSAAALGAAAVASVAAVAKARGRVARSAKVVTYVDGKARFVTEGGAASQSAGPFSPESQLGVLAPTGFWDPLGFCDGISEMEFKRLRSCEIKHGRLAMMATIGYIYTFYDRLPGYLSPSAGLKFADLPNGLEAASRVPSGGWVQIFLFAAFCEFGFKKGIEEWKTGEPGDYGYGFLGLFGPVMDPEKKKRSLTAEISNGRLAMMAITGMVVQEGCFGTTGMWFGS